MHSLRETTEFFHLKDHVSRCRSTLRPSAEQGTSSIFTARNFRGVIYFVMMLFRRAFGLMALLLSAISAAAATTPSILTWENAEQNVTTRPGQESVSVVYAFRNATDHAVHIMNIEAGCTCTTATVAKNEFAAGERGEMTVKFMLGERVGRQERVITVITDDPVAPLSAVKLNVEIPELATVRPRVLFWQTGAKPETKVVEITLAYPENSRLETPKDAEPGFVAKLQSTNRAGVYRLEVTPKNTTETIHAAIHIAATVQGTTQTLAVFAAVK
jgi:hypothetical protein